MVSKPKFRSLNGSLPSVALKLYFTDQVWDVICAFILGFRSADQIEPDMSKFKIRGICTRTPTEVQTDARHMLHVPTDLVGSSFEPLIYRECHVLQIQIGMLLECHSAFSLMS
jgi:hypothetical protein